MSVASNPKQKKVKQGKPKRRLLHGELVLYDRVLQPADDSKSYKFSQWVFNITATQTALTNAVGAFSYSLSNLDQYTSFTGLFDQYRITKISIQFRPMFTNFTPSSSTLVPLIYTACDFDDDNNPTISGIKEYQNCQVHEYETFTHVFTPHAAIAAYSGSFTSYANMAKPWIDVASPNVKHFGLKYAIEAGISGQTQLQSWNISSRLEVEFKHVR